MSQLPLYRELPVDKSISDSPIAWHVFGQDDLLGTINNLTPAAVIEARQEIQTGHRVSLDLAIGEPEFPICGRSVAKQRVIGDGGSLDDELTFNTQQGSQWDGLRHFSMELPDGSRCHYNGLPFKGAIIDSSPKSHGVQHWVKHGIAGRGVLLDYATYAEEKGIAYDALSDYGITAQDLSNVAQHFNVQFKNGDIAFLRVGHQSRMAAESRESQKKIAEELVAFAGVAQGDGQLEFVWNKRFSAFASDGPTFERHPVRGEMLHYGMLCRLGCPIGELFALDDLAAKCTELGRYSFFVASVPLNVPGGVASPPNMMAIF